MTDATDLAVINKALARIGEGPIAALTEDSDRAEQVAAVFGDVVDAAHAAYSWKFARRTSRLIALAPPFPADPSLPGQFNGWPYAYSYPVPALSDPLGLYLSWPDTTLREFQTEGRTVYAGSSVVFGTFIQRIDSGDWPPLFRLAVTMWLAAELAIPVTHDKGLADQLMASVVGTPSEKLQGGLIGRAIALDVARGGSTAVSATQSDPLTTARFDGDPSSWWYGG